MEIHWERMSEINDAQRDAIEVRLQRLADQHNDLYEIRIVGHPSHHHRQGGQGVHIRCSIRGEDLFAERERDDLGTALHDAVHALEREIHDRRSRLLDRRNHRSKANRSDDETQTR